MKQQVMEVVTFMQSSMTKFLLLADTSKADMKWTKHGNIQK